MDRPVFVAQLVANYTEAELRLLERIYSSPQKTKMERKSLQAHYWMGDSTMPGSSEEKFAKLALAFESAIGAEARRVNEIGITEMLAERAAFLLGDTPDARIQWHDAVKDLYGLRSKVLHGESTPVSDEQLLKWGFLVWNTVRAVLSQTHRFKNVDDLAAWIRVAHTRNSLNIMCCLDAEIASVIGQLQRPSSPCRYESASR
jgi:hypothetical protein